MLGNLTQFQPEIILTAYDNIEFILRMLLATVCGGLIGLERSIRLKEAGIRTHCLVAMSAALFMILSKYAFMDVVNTSLGKADASRIASQVVSGISFLGAGIIFKQRNSGVTGLTTAAGIWATSALGLAFGAGMYFAGISGTLIILCLQFLLHKHSSGSSAPFEYDLYIRMKDDPKLNEDFLALLKKRECSIENTRIKKDGDMVEMKLFARSEHELEHDDILLFVQDHPDVEEFGV